MVDNSTDTLKGHFAVSDSNSDTKIISFIFDTLIQHFNKNSVQLACSHPVCVGFLWVLHSPPTVHTQTCKLGELETKLPVGVNGSVNVFVYMC